VANGGLGIPAALADAGLWVGLLLTLLLFSQVLGENVLARLAQHLLLGAGLGYGALLAVESVLSPRLLAPLARGQWATHVAPLALGLLLLVAGIERIQAQGRPATQPRLSRRILQTAGVVPIALLLGVGIAAGALGILEGTLLPQAITTMAAGGNATSLWVGLLVLLLTTAALLATTLEQRVQVEPLPGPLRGVLRLWIWIGERAIWIVSGVLLARLFAARLSLLVDRLAYLAATLQATGLWQWFERIWQNLIS
jgi:hypothetical protein